MITGLSYLLLSITGALLLGLAGRQRHDSRIGLDVYSYPPALLWALAFLTPVPGALAVFLYLTWPQANKPTGLGLVALFAVAGVAILAFIYASLYANAFRVEVAERELRIKTWRNDRRIFFADVADVNVFDGRTAAGGTRRLIVYLRNGHKVIISGVLTDFDDLAGSLLSRIAKGNNDANRSSDKLIDLELSARNKRRENLVAYYGLVIIVAAVIVIWALTRFR